MIKKIIAGVLLPLCINSSLVMASQDADGYNPRFDGIKNSKNEYQLVIKSQKPFYVGALPYVLIIDGQEFTGSHHGYSGDGEFTLEFHVPSNKMSKLQSKSSSSQSAVLGYGHEAARTAYTNLVQGKSLLGDKTSDHAQTRSWTLGPLDLKTTK